MAIIVNYYDRFIEFVGDNSVDLDADSFRAELYNSTHTFVATNTARADISANALATANGYTNPGQVLTGVTWVTTGSGPSVQVFDANDFGWTAAGGDIGPARHLIFYDDTATVPAADVLMCDVDFGQDETAIEGTDFNITFATGGIFQIVG